MTKIKILGKEFEVGDMVEVTYYTNYYNMEVTILAYLRAESRKGDKVLFFTWKEPPDTLNHRFEVGHKAIIDIKKLVYGQ